MTKENDINSSVLQNIVKDVLAGKENEKFQQIFSNVNNITYILIDVGTNDPQNKHVSLLLPKDSEYYNNVFEISKKFVNEQM